MSEQDYCIRGMTRQEVEVAIDWAAAEGWNPGRFDADCFYAADPEGFLIGLIEDEPVATISAVSYGNSFGFIGFYIVRPDVRGQGYGLRIWRAAMNKLSGRNIGLDGVLAQQGNYERSGFALAYRNIRFAAQVGGHTADMTGILPLASVPFARLLAYDRPFFPDDRTSFLRCWINQFGGPALGIEHDGMLAGYGVLRPCRSGYKIGPLFADDAELADRLYQALSAGVEAGATLFLDAPEVNPAALDLAEKHGMRKVFETVRMYTGPTPELPLQRLFGVTSFELG